MRATRWISVCLLASVALATMPGSALAGTAREQEAFADDAIVRMKENATEVRTELQGARSRRDAARTQCLNAKLTQLEVVERQAEDARSALRRASLREDMDAMAQASHAMTHLDGSARELRSEANQCAGAQELLASQRDVRRMAQRSRAVALNDLASGETAMEGESILAAVSTAPRRPGLAPSPATIATALSGPTPSATTPAPSGSPYASDTAHEASLLAYSADFTLAVFQVDKSLASVESLARELGGYLAQRGDAQITIRVPRPRFDEAIARLEQVGDVVHRNISAEDVTDEYVDLELRLKNARVMRDQLAALLRGAVVKDAVEIEKELAKVTEVIEQIEGRLKVMRDKVGYSSITVSFQAQALSPVRTTAILPFTWLDTMGLEPLLSVPKVSP